MKAAAEGVAMLTISTIAEALAELERQTGRAWTDSELFDVATANGISLHAAPPITASSGIYEFVPGDGLIEKHRMAGGRAALAVLFPWQVGQLWISGETKTAHPSDHDRMEGQHHWFTEPVKVTREQVRIVGGTLRQIVDLWRVATAWDGRQPPSIRPAWLVLAATQQEKTRTEPVHRSETEQDMDSAGLKKSALISMHRHEWPTIEADLREASRNGLGAARVKHGFWDESAALNWAKRNGKIRQGSPMNSPFQIRRIRGV